MRKIKMHWLQGVQQKMHCDKNFQLNAIDRGKAKFHNLCWLSSYMHPNNIHEQVICIHQRTDIEDILLDFIVGNSLFSLHVLCFSQLSFGRWHENLSMHICIEIFAKYDSGQCYH